MEDLEKRHQKHHVFSYKESLLHQLHKFEKILLLAQKKNFLKILPLILNFLQK